MRLVFLGSPPFATPVLARLLASPLRPVLVVTPPDRPSGRHRVVEESELAALARAQGVAVDQPPTVRDEAFLARLRALAPEVILVAAYGEYLTAEFRSLASLEILNVHPSLLPRHRGASPIQAAIASGDPVTGVSIQRVVKEVDAGDVALTLETEIGAEETAGELGERLARLGGEASVRVLEGLVSGTTIFVPQDPSRATVCTKLAKEDGEIAWGRSAVELANLVRAMNPWPLARTVLPGGGELLVLSSRPLESGGSVAVSPGTLIETGRRLVVRAGEGALELMSVKPAGKRAMSAAEFLRGAHLHEGARLGP